MKNDPLIEFKAFFSKRIRRGEILSFEKAKMIFKEQQEIKTKESFDSSCFENLLLWYKEITQFSYLEKFFRESSEIEDIIVHSHSRIQTSIKNKLETYKLHLTAQDFLLSLEFLALANRTPWNYSSPFISFHGIIRDISFRISLVHSCLSPHQGPKLFLRKLNDSPLLLSDFAISQDQAKIITQSVNNHKNIIICGPSGSGKTTLLKLLVKQFKKDEHVVIMEDTHEIMSDNTNTTHLLAKDGHNELANFCSYTLRLRPDRIILGEIRGEEIIPLFLTLNNGHNFLTTTHASNWNQAIHRLTLLFLIYSKNKNFPYEQAKELILSSVDLIISMDKKRITEIKINA